MLPTALNELLPGDPRPTHLGLSSDLLGACHKMTLVCLVLGLPESADPWPLKAQLSGSPRLAVSLALRDTADSPLLTGVTVNKDHRPSYAQGSLADAFLSLN